MSRGSFPPVVNRAWISCWKAILGGVGLLILAVAPASLEAQTTWDGGGTDNLWATPGNWTGDAVPGTSTNVVFGDLDKTDSSTPNSILGVSSTIRTLTFSNSGTGTNDWQNLEIDSGATLTISLVSNVTSFLVAGVPNTATQAKIGGAGGLVIEGGTLADFIVRGPTSGTITSYATPALDMSGLASFDATLDQFAVGSTGVGLATVTLAQDNDITANAIIIGTNQKNTSSGAGGNSAMNLGETNILNVDQISVGNTNSRTGGALQFAEDGGSVTIRGRAGGVTRANMIVAQGGDGSGATTSTADFTGGSIDARFGELVVGSSSVGNTNAITGNFLMDSGTVDATSVIVGRRTSNGSGSAVGNLTVAGGFFQTQAMTIGLQAGTVTNTATGVLNVSGTGTVQVGTSENEADLVMGEVTGTVNLTSNATVNLTSGTLRVFGNIAEGANAGTGTITSTLNLQGGTLDVTGHSVTVDTFAVESGTLRNLGEFNAGADLVKTTAGTLILDGENTYSGSTVVSAGTLTLASTGSMEFFIQADGVNNALLGSGTVSLDGEFVFNLSGAASVGTWAIVDWDSLAGGFGASFAVQGWNDAGADVWEFNAGGGVVYSFSEATGVLTAVPEPGISVLLGVGLAMVLWRSGRRLRV